LRVNNLRICIVYFCLSLLTAILLDGLGDDSGGGLGGVVLLDERGRGGDGAEGFAARGAEGDRRAGQQGGDDRLCDTFAFLCVQKTVDLVFDVVVAHIR